MLRERASRLLESLCLHCARIGNGAPRQASAEVWPATPLATIARISSGPCGESRRLCPGSGATYATGTSGISSQLQVLLRQVASRHFDNVASATRFCAAVLLYGLSLSMQLQRENHPIASGF